LVWVSLKHKEDTFFASNKTAHPRGQGCIIFKGKKKNTRKKLYKGVCNQGELQRVSKEMTNIKGKINI
jgi:hypothetical protein